MLLSVEVMMSIVSLSTHARRPQRHEKREWSDDRGARHQCRYARRHAACRRRLSPRRVRQIPRAVRVSAAQQGHPGSRHCGYLAAATGAPAPLWFGPIEPGDTRRFIATGYVHVIAQPRGSAKSEGHYGHEDTDHYDLIEWITQQQWSNGKVGMVGISGYAGEQWRAAAQGHPALKAIFPYDACSAYGGMFGLRDFNA